MRKLLFTLILQILFCFCVFAQKAKFEFYTTADGLTVNLVSGLTQDEQGMIWLVNGGKLFRFDGKVFLENPLSSPLLSKGNLRDIRSFQDSLIFIISANEGFILNPQKGTCQSFLPKGEKENNYTFRNEKKLDNGNIIIYGNKNNDTFNRVYWLFDGYSIQPLTHLSHQNPKTVFSADLKESKFIRYLKDKVQIINTEKESKVELNTEYGSIIMDFHYQIDSTGKILFELGNKFYFFNDANNTITPHPINRHLENKPLFPVNFLLEENGSLWICGGLRNLSYYNAQKDTLYNFQKKIIEVIPNESRLHHIFKDKTGILWISTLTGLLKVTPQHLLFDTYFTTNEKPYIDKYGFQKSFFSFRGFTENDQGIIYAGFYDGVAKIDPKQKISSIPFPAIGVPFDLEIVDNKIWLNHGVLLDPQTKTLIEPKESSPWRGSDSGIFEVDENNKLWWSFFSKIFYLDTIDNSLAWQKEINLPLDDDTSADAFHIGKKSKKLWIGIHSNFFGYHPETKKLEQFSHKEIGLEFSRVMAIEEDAKGDIWLGTDIGLIKFSPVNGLLHHFTIDEGLPNNYICGMLTEGDSCLWLSTNNGLSRFNINKRTFINFSEDDGLSTNEFNRMSYYKAKNGQMFFGSIRGVNAFFPAEIMSALRKQNDEVSLVLSTFEYVDERSDTLIQQHTFETNPEIHLFHWDKSFSFTYTLTDYTNPKELLYSYKMEGYENIWSAPSNYNFTRFSSLPSGNYTFKVKARDTRGAWHPKELAVKIIVHPPWWETNFAYFSYFILFVGVMLGIFYFLRKRWRLLNELKLEQAEANRLKELDSFKNRLYTNLTHEFRTPLTVILGMIQQIRSEPKVFLEEGARMIETNGQNLLRLINQLLDLSKLENQSFKLQLKQGDILPYLKYLTESFHSYVNSKNLSLRFFTPLESLVMDHDPEQIKQALTNLISNAIKFTPSGGEIMVKVITENDQLIIEVKDTGIGILEKDLPFIFDRFYQVDGSMTREGEGTGIGLAHTQELVKLMGGEISVKSELEIGSTFIIKIPIRNTVLQNDPSTVNKKTENPIFDLPRPIQTTNTLEMPTVLENCPTLLIIEDNPDIVIYLKSCLKSLYQIDIAYNGKIGIEKALETIPDLIISDVMMPGKDGFEVCDVLKKDERTSHIPLILLTAKADSSSKITGLKRGADAYLSKPFDKDELLVRLELLVERQKKMATYFSKNNYAKETLPVEIDIQEAIQVEDIFIKKVKNIIEENYSDENFALPQLCQKIRMSRSQLFRKMKALIGTSPSEFIRKYRLEKAKHLLETTEMNVSEVSWKVGFKDLSHFSKAFQSEFGYLPSATNK